MTASLHTLLVANRGEIALRIFRAARTLGLRTIAVYSEDDAQSLHVRRADESILLPGTGPAAYLDAESLVKEAADAHADAVHPGYGFLSESAHLARLCLEAGIQMVGPSPETLATFGDKGAARRLAAAQQVPLLPGTEGATSLSQMADFMDALPAGTPVMVKALAGGGGRGVRVVRDRGSLTQAFDEASTEANASFGCPDLYVEQLLDDGHHVEVQVIGDGTGQVTHLWDRDCSVQRRHQKLIEIAPSKVLAEPARAELLSCAVRLTASTSYKGLATVEFLATTAGDFYFLEVNPRVQVEHTVTEEVLGVDLVQAQLRIAAGRTLAELGLTQSGVRSLEGSAIQIRVNAETMGADGSVKPAVGIIDEVVIPAGAGIRVDSAAYPGMQVNPRFDSLLMKVIVHDREGFQRARVLAEQALSETTFDGIETNLAFQQAILQHQDFVAGACDTAWVDRHLIELSENAAAITASSTSLHRTRPRAATESAVSELATDPRAVSAPFGGLVVDVNVAAGDRVESGTLLAVVEAMKMQHHVVADRGGQIEQICVAPGDIVTDGAVLALLERDGAHNDHDNAPATVDLEQIRPDLRKLSDRRRKLTDDARPDAVAKRHNLGMRTARENIADLTDGGLSVEYGGFAVAAQRTRRDLSELEDKTPADGIVTGLGTVNGALFDASRSTCAILAYDYTVLAGTQGHFNHKKTDRLLDLALRANHPVVLFAEGGGGRPGDVDIPKVGALDVHTFAAMGALSGKVPTIGIAAGRCFAGNAALLGSCDIVIATRNSNIGMGGPAMIEGGGLGVVTPDQIGPIDVQTRNGVVDLAVADEHEAVQQAKKYLSYFQGSLPSWEVSDQRILRHLIPLDRKRVYDIRDVIENLFDKDSVLELRKDFGPGLITALARIEGRPIGVVANNPSVMGGAIVAEGADKAARFLQLCDAFGIPIVSLCDTPGFMVGPEAEKQASVRHFPRLFVLGGHLTVPIVTVVLRKAYGLGALAMSAGSFANTTMTVTWPTGEFGGMGLEGAVRLGFRDELAAIDDRQLRQERYEQLVATMYERGSAINTASHLELDEVIDPADTRSTVLGAMLAHLPPREGWVNPHRRSGVDTW